MVGFGCVLFSSEFIFVTFFSTFKIGQAMREKKMRPNNCAAYTRHAPITQRRNEANKKPSNNQIVLWSAAVCKANVYTNITLYSYSKPNRFCEIKITITG